eukprot:gene11458-15313_t
MRGMDYDNLDQVLQLRGRVRGMMQEPDLVLADEPVASLDPVNADVVMDALQRICRERNVPVIVNLHSLDIARRYCTRVVAMSKGAIVFDGPPTALTQTVLDRVCLIMLRLADRPLETGYLYFDQYLHSELTASDDSAFPVVHVDGQVHDCVLGPWT